MMLRCTSRDTGKDKLTLMLYKKPLTVDHDFAADLRLFHYDVSAVTETQSYIIALTMVQAQVCNITCTYFIPYNRDQTILIKT